jgi:CHAT domain-containing protein
MTPGDRRRLGQAAFLLRMVDRLSRQGGPSPAREPLEALGELYPRHRDVLGELGKANLKAAVPLCKLAAEILADKLGEKHPLHAATLGDLCRLHRTLGDHKAALPLAETVSRLRKESLGEKHPLYAASLSRLARLRHETGDHKAALALGQKALEIIRQALGERHANYAACLENLARFRVELAGHASALPLYQKALAVHKDALGEKHPDYAAVLAGLASLYADVGDYKSAIPHAKKAAEVVKRTHGEKTADYAASLERLARLHLAAGDDKEALAQAKEAARINEQAVGARHAGYALSLSTLAAVHLERGEQKESVADFQKASEILKEALGKKHPLYAQSLRDLASAHQEAGDVKEALPLAKEAAELVKEARGTGSLDWAASLHDLAVLRYEAGEYDEARKLSEQSLEITRQNLHEAASLQSERQQLLAAAAVRARLDFRLSLPEDGKDASACYRHVLAGKGAVFVRQHRRRLFIALSGDSRPEVRKLASGLDATSRELAFLALGCDGPATGDRLEKIERLTKQKEAQEVALAKLTAEFRDARGQEELTPDGLRESLPAGVVLVDFLFYSRRDRGQKDRTKRWQRRLAAFVVRRDAKVARLDLGPADAIEQAVASWRETLGKKSLDQDDPGAALKKLVWAPLAKHLEKAGTVLLSPDGALARAPFAALPGRKEKTYLLEDLALAVVPVPQAIPSLLAPVNKERRLPPSLLVVGGVDFDKIGKSEPVADDRSAPRGKLKSWGKLEATRGEALAVKDSFGRLFRGRTVTDLWEGEATKKAVREAAPRRRFVHLATHGFFAPPELKSALDGSKGGSIGREGLSGWHPLLLSGVVLAGANGEAKSGEEDGILTALEVAELDLTRCELAVLSACETGLGAEAGGEGLLGLQRAFQVAGARSVVASLWQVNDEATQKLMTAFYAAYWDRKEVVSRAAAFRKAQLLMLRQGRERGMVRREKGVEDGAPVPPFYWAGFVLSGDWR